MSYVGFKVDGSKVLRCGESCSNRCSESLCLRNIVVDVIGVAPVFLIWHAQGAFSIGDREEDRGGTQGSVPVTKIHL